MALRGRAHYKATRACRVSLIVPGREIVQPRALVDKHARTKN